MATARVTVDESEQMQVKREVDSVTAEIIEEFGPLNGLERRQIEHNLRKRRELERRMIEIGVRCPKCGRDGKWVASWGPDPASGVLYCRYVDCEGGVVKVVPVQNEEPE